MTHGRFDNPLSAALAGVKDLFRGQALARELTDDLRLDGRTCLVTGASSGLGFAVATQLAQRGARVLMACRSGIPEKGEEVRRLSGSDRVEMLQVDLSDLEQVHALADRLKGEELYALVENAGVASVRARRTAQGLEAMFVTNYLSKFLLLNRLLSDGTIRGEGARIVIISSDSHRGASAIDFEELGTYAELTIKRAINNYSYFKLVLNTFAVELSRRTEVPVHCICPGPVDTNIIREAPAPLMLILKTIFAAFFRKPEVAARPVIYMCASPTFGRETGRYLHMFNPRQMDPKCYDPAQGRRLWDRSIELLSQAGAWDRVSASAARA